MHLRVKKLSLGIFIHVRSKLFLNFLYIITPSDRQGLLSPSQTFFWKSFSPAESGVECGGSGGGDYDMQTS